jgi:transcription initiation factor TFIIH subunit 4
MERSAQVWFFIINYLQVLTQERGLDLLECLTFIFQLSFSTLGKDYSREGMTQCQEELLQHLRMFGLVYQRKRSSRRYYPTKLAVNLVSGARHSLSSQTSTSLPSASPARGFVVIETNFRVLAYTDSQLQIAILSLFCQLQYRFPNMVVGTVTRESIHQALINGIIAEQILSFLRLHAHSHMMVNSPIIPPTVTDQIRLWEMERNRLQFEEGVLYSEFMSASDFDKVKRYAEDLGVLSWSNPGRRLMVVTQYGHEEVRRFWRRQKNI